MNKARRLTAESVEQIFFRITTHPLFLGGIGLALNLAAYRKLIAKKMLRQFWGSLELPNKAEQEQALYLLSELENRLLQMEKKLNAQSHKKEDQTEESKTTRRPFLEDASFQ
jgi:hypothetical protein